MAAVRCGVKSFAARILSSSCGCSRVFSSATTLQAGQKWRTSEGKAADGINYGPLTDLPDWSYADGRAAPETKRRQLRLRRRLDVAARIDKLLSEVDNAKESNRSNDNKNTDVQSSNS